MAHHIAIYTIAIGHIGGFENQRLFWQTLGHGGQLACGDKFGDPSGFGIGGQGLVFIDIGAVDVNRLALRVEFWWFWWLGGGHHFGIYCRGRYTQKQRSHRCALNLCLHRFLPWPIGRVSTISFCRFLVPKSVPAGSALGMINVRDKSLANNIVLADCILVF